MKQLLVTLFLLITATIFAQQHAFVGVQTDYGYLVRSFDKGGDILSSNSVGSALNLRFSGSYRIFDRLQIEGGIGLNRHGIQLKDNNFIERNPGFEVPIRITTWFTNYFVSFKYSQRIGTGRYLYGKLGFELNQIKAGSRTASDTYVVGFEDLSITSNYIEKSNSIVPEIGVETFLKNGGMLGCGIKYTLTNTPMMTANYRSDGASGVVAEDKVTLSGSNIAFNVHYNHLLFYAPKREKKKKYKAIDIAPQPSVVEEPVAEEPKEEVVVTKTEANDRDYKITHKVKVHSAKVRVEVWDHQIEDGDIVSLILNDKYLIQNYTLTKQKKVFEVELQEGNNSFILYAHNLGKYKPNTASVLVDDGSGKPQTIILESDLQQSGALDIKYVPKK